MHPTRTVRLGCVDCHGGDATAILPPGTSNSAVEYEQLKNRAHPRPDDPALKESLQIQKSSTRNGCARITRTFASSTPVICESLRKLAAGRDATPRKS